ncbi:hypothetical protein V6N13_140414 [Hibiscus sabdariffa]|uniref:Uncharacterized protein n=1 Tax=Hibiscus sabdariffa TaxID=183260 RepID=A0ABR2QA35_9ROSI
MFSALWCSRFGKLQLVILLWYQPLGNDGPLYGTLNNPADAKVVLLVSVALSIASFSSRGMTTSWYGPISVPIVLKPSNLQFNAESLCFCYDVPSLLISKLYDAGSCQRFYLIIFAVTVVSNQMLWIVLCLLVLYACFSVSFLRAKERRFLTPARMKRALLEGAAKLAAPNMYQHGLVERC